MISNFRPPVLRLSVDRAEKIAGRRRALVARAEANAPSVDALTLRALLQPKLNRALN